MGKNKIIIACFILGILFVFFSVAGLLSFFPRLPICHALQKEGGMTPASPIFSPDGKKIAFLGYVLIKRPPVGICTFPDGGSPLITRNEIQVYETDMQKSAPHLIVEIPISDQYGLSADGYRMLGWDKNNIFLWVYYPNDGSGKKHYLQVDVTNKKYIELSGNTEKTLEAKFWGESRFNPLNKSNWVDYDIDAKSIGIYTGGKWQFDSERKSIFQSGYPATSLMIETIVDEPMIEKLQPSLD